jgi:glyoxylate reductase
MDSPDRADLFANLKQGGKYEGTVAIYRYNTSTDRVGVFDRALIGALPPGIKWIALNGAGYDQIDVHACKEKGTRLLSALYPTHSILKETKLIPLVSRNHSL